MARTGVLTLRDIHDAKVAKMTADTGVSKTYDSIVDVSGIQGASLQPEFETGELYGDGKVLDYYSKFRKLTGSFRHAQISMDVLEVLLGGTRADTGTTPNEKATFSAKGVDLPGYFKFEAQCLYQGGLQSGGAGDHHLIIYKAKITNFSIEWQSEDYAQVSFDFEGIATNFDDLVWDLVENETAADIT